MKLKREVKAAYSSTEDEAMRVELLNRAELGEGNSSSSSAQRDALLSATERVRATGERITQGRQVPKIPIRRDCVIAAVLIAGAAVRHEGAHPAGLGGT